MFDQVEEPPHHYISFGVQISFRSFQAHLVVKIFRDLICLHVSRSEPYPVKDVSLINPFHLDHLDRNHRGPHLLVYATVKPYLCFKLLID
jgi:hypothetical protein